METLRSLLVDLWPSFLLVFSGHTLIYVTGYLPVGRYRRLAIALLGAGTVLVAVYMGALITRNRALAFELERQKAEVVRISKMVK